MSGGKFPSKPTRKPPKLGPVNKIKVAHSELTAATPESTLDNGLTDWSSLTPEGQSSIIQLWLSQPWSSLDEFCGTRGLKMTSIRDAFQNRGIPMSRTRMESATAMDRVASSVMQGLTTLQSGHSLMQVIIDRLLMQIITEPSLSLNQLRDTLSDAAEAVAKVGISMAPLKGLFDRIGLDKDEVEEGVSRSVTVLTQGQRQRLARDLREQANQLASASQEARLSGR